MNNVNNSTDKFEDFKNIIISDDNNIDTNRSKLNLYNIETKNFIIEKIREETSTIYLPIFNKQISELRQNIKDVDEKGYMTQKHAGWLSVIFTAILTTIITIGGFAFRYFILDTQQNENKILKESFNTRIEIINNNFNERIDDMKDFINISNQLNNSQPTSQKHSR